MADTTQGGFTTGSDTRKVIKNATKDPTMSGNTTKTIMSSDELRSKDRKLDVHLGKAKTATPKNNNVTVPQTTTAPTNTPVSTGANVPMTQQTGGNNIGLNGISVPVAGQNTAPQMSQDAFVNTNGRAADLATLNVLDVDGMLEDLFIDVGEGLQNGKLSTTPVSKIKERYNELGLMDDKVVTDLVSDIAKMHQKGLSMDLNATEKLKSLYPELAGVERGFYSSNPNMYQAGGMKEVMNANTPFNLNKYGTLGTVAETVANPLGQPFTALDAATQTISQVDGNEQDLTVGDWIANPLGSAVNAIGTGEPELKKRLASLTDEEIQQYYQRYLNAVEENPTLSQAWTRRVPGDTVVEQIWNMVSGNTFIDKDAGFRDWLIDQVNLEENGWKGEFFGAANKLKGMSGPNIVRMYANIPASAEKTVTAILNAATNPIDTAGGLFVLGKDLVENINEKGWWKGFSDSIIGQRYGSWEALGNAMEQDPIGVASDALMLVEGGEGAIGNLLKLSRWGARGARLATHMMGAERMSKGLTRIANRLDKMAKTSKEVSKVSGTASNLGVDQFLHGWTTPKGKKIPGLINGLEEWAKSSNSLAAKGAKYLAEHTTTKPAVETAKALLHPTKTLAGKLTGTSTPESKLFQAASPNINKLTKGVDYKNKKANMDTATQAIVDAGYTPKTVAEWAQAHVDTLNKLWDEFTAKVKGKADVEVDASRVVQKAEAYIAEIGEDLAENQRSDLKALKNEVSRIKKRGKINMKSLENLKEMFNAETRNKTNTAKGEIYTRGLKKLSEAIGDIQNEILSKSPDEVKALKKKIGALLDTKEDVIKANVKQQKRKESGGLVENYGRLSGIGDIIGGTFSIPVRGGEGVAQAAKGLGKLILGKALGKAKDADFLTEQGFKGLQKKSGKTADSTKSLKKKEITKGSDLDALYNLKIAKDELKKKLDKGQISKDEYKRRVDDIDYDISQLKARGAKGDVEYELKSEEGKALEKKYGEEMMEKKLGFRKETEEAIKSEMKRAEENGETVRGWTKVKQKLYALSKNPTSTTAQHEFFHAVFDVVDPTTRRYLLDEAKKIMKENGMSDANAEEWLAESFAIYAKRKDIKLGVLERRKGIQGIKDRIGDFFQRVYEWLQNYNGDRRAINKIFNTILDNKWNLDSNGGLDLSYLLGNKALPKKRELGNAKGGVKFKKDTGAIKYKTDVNGKSVDIDTKATSPDQLAKINSDGLSVMKSFISEKQAKKALDVSKELLDDKGNPYLWTHTNKYTAQPFTAFENFGDSKYKEFVDKEIAWVTNNEYMSKSYANWDTILADTKPTTIKEINDKTLKTEKSKGVDVPLGKDKSLKANIIYENGEELIKNGDKYELVKRNKMVYEFDASVDKILDDIDVAKEGYTWDSAVGEEEKTHPLTKEERIERLKFRIGGSYSWGKYDVEVKELPNGKTQITKSWKDGEVLKSFDSKAAALADVKASNKGKSKYHYQGIVQDVKKPLVVDMKGEGGASFWNRLGNAYDFLKKNDEAGLKKLEKVEDKLKSFVKEYTDKRQELDVEAQKLRETYSERMRNYKSPKRFDDPTITQAEKEQAMKEVDRLEEESRLAHIAKFNIVEMLWGEKPDMGPYMDWINSHKDFKELYDKVNKFVSDNKDLGQFINKPTQTDLINWLSKNGVDEATSSLLHGMRMKPLDQLSLVGALKNKSLQTNDYVFYALRKGDYDGVLFKNIIDYGAEPKWGWGMAEGGDVLAAFNSKQFKAWDNANPTDSKYISYKKDTGLKAKLPDTDNDGRKLSEAQRKFFAGTKVVDKNGNLLRVYHGTRGGDFTVFRKGNSWSNNLAKVGYWFTPNKEGALRFAEGSWGGDAKPRAEEVYLDIKNPKVYEPSKFNLLKNEERNAKIDEQRKVYNQKADKADGLDYTHAGGFFHDEFDHPYYDRAIFEYLKRSWDNDRKYDGKYGKYNPEEYRALADEWNRNRNANLDYDKILKDFEEYTKAKLDEEKEYSKLLDIKHNDPYDDFMYDIYKIDSNYDNKWTKDDLNRALNDYDSPNKFVDKLKSEGYDGIIIKGTEYDGEVIGGGARNDQYVAFDSNQIKRITNENPTKNDDIRFKKGYHGSPAKFDRFDSTHMGEGEGAQAHGWGHYIAIDKATAEKYAISRNSEYKGMPIEDFFKTKEGKVYSNIEKEAIRKVGEYIPTYTAEEAIEILPDDLYPPKTAYDRAVINAIQNLDPADFNSGRHLYDVDFKDPARKNTPSGWNYLDEETPYSRKTFDKIFEEAKKQGWDESKARNYIDDKLKFNGNDKMYGVWIRQALDMGFGEESGKKTSKFLESLGYDGIHYNGLQDGEAYVLFGDDTGKITNHVAFKKDVKGLGKKQDNDSGLRYKKARHGSPASFDKFDSSHMGEGEGAQVHGWGHYVAVNKETGLHYGKMGARKYQGKQIGGFGNLYDELYNSKEYSVDVVNAVKEIAEMADRENISIKDAKAKALERRKGWLKDAEERLEKAKKRGIESNIQDTEYIVKRSKILIDTIKDIDEKDFNTRNLYELEIPDPVKRDTPTGSNYLEEDKYYSKAEVKKFLDAMKNIDSGWLKDTKESRIYDLYKKGLDIRGKDLYDMLAYAKGDKQASKFLESLGYDGIHYYGGRDGEAYVLFNDDAPQIQNHIRYKKDVNSEGKKLSEGQIKHFEYSKARNNKGELIPVYRGTRNIEGDFFKWSEDHQTGDNYGKAFYFTTNKHQAEGYAHITDKDPRWIKYDAEHNGLLKKFKETRSDEDLQAFLDHGKDYDVWGDMDNNPSKYPEAMGEVREYYLNIENPLEYDAKGERYFRVYDNLFKQARENGNDGIIVRNVIDNSVTKDGKGEIMDVFVTFNENQAKYTDNLNPTTSDNKRFKKDVNGLSKKDNGLRKKADIQQKTSSLGRHKSEIDSFARQLGVTGDTPLQKMKQMNKIIKDPKYQGTKIKKDLYALKWDIKKEYILDNNKKIKDRGPNNTKLVVWQNGEKATWHFIPSQYYELKRMGVLE